MRTDKENLVHLRTPLGKGAGVNAHGNAPLTARKPEQTKPFTPATTRVPLGGKDKNARGNAQQQTAKKLAPLKEPSTILRTQKTPKFRPLVEDNIQPAANEPETELEATTTAKVDDIDWGNVEVESITSFPEPPLEDLPEGAFETTDEEVARFRPGAGAVFDVPVEEDITLDMMPPLEFDDEDLLPEPPLMRSAQPPKTFSPLRSNAAKPRRPAPPANGVSLIHQSPAPASPATTTTTTPRRIIPGPGTPGKRVPTFMMPTKAAQLKQRVRQPPTGASLRR